MTTTPTKVTVGKGKVLWTWSIQDGVLVEERYTLGQGSMSHGAMDLLRGPNVNNVLLAVQTAAQGEIVE